ncbi:hypothetical protein PAAG_02949 [Paracoccidioides lutzii Pb01]|uniref:Uncharacterized protein n=1 Tax=Paracoccidioides lutzii (strain ATCC MYA-826 / Pb01) TaxID=502779 RepID=C1GWQ4_PARBA|nr:hypothetical protein PAAG_02949 [Paracoccidioides lutzii Pb01]EEH40973.2 hypothetical protein PAAG_02949 [Paracoccidioides lutzii Pb01]
MFNVNQPPPGEPAEPTPQFSIPTLVTNVVPFFTRADPTQVRNPRRNDLLNLTVAALLDFLPIHRVVLQVLSLATPRIYPTPNSSRDV